jgi:Flp pilus assembly protein TadD
MKKKKVTIAVLLGMTVLVYYRVIYFQFINLDDSIYVINNLDIQDSFNLKSISWALTTLHAAFWHPLTWFSYLLDYQLYGLNPGGYHLTNLLFHLASTVMLFLVLEKMTHRFWPSALVSALFAIHPLHVESVAWIAERKDVLSTFFWILTLGAYVRYVEHPCRSRYGLVLAAFIGGLMAKPMVVTLPFVLLLLDFWPLGRLVLFTRENRPLGEMGPSQQPLKTLPLLLLEKIPLFFLSAVAACLAFYAQQKIGAVNPFFPLPTRMANALISYLLYLGKMVWPLNLSVFYPYQKTWPVWQIFAAGMILSVISFGVIRKAGRYPYLLFGWLWYVGTLIPVIGLIQVGIHSMADRYTYVPLIGIYIALAWGGSDLFAKWPKRSSVLAVLTGLGVLFLMVLSWNQVGYWRNSQTLFQQALRATPKNFRAHNLMGYTLMEQGHIDQALFHFREAVRINPKYGSAYMNMGLAFEKTGNPSEAMIYYRIATGLPFGAAEAHYNLGILLVGQGQLDEALNHFQAVIRLKKDNAEAYNNLGLVFQSRGKTKEAIEAFNQAITLKPRLAEARYNLGTVLATIGQLKMAEEHLKTALHIQPRYVQALNNLGLIQEAEGRGSEALASWQQALKIDPGFRAAAENLQRMRPEKK